MDVVAAGADDDAGGGAFRASAGAGVGGGLLVPGAVSTGDVTPGAGASAGGGAFFIRRVTSAIRSVTTRRLGVFGSSVR